jgi:preprotein translocase subunit SecA
MTVLTKTSVISYQKLLKNIIDISPFEMFLDIGVELVELQPEEPYIHFLIELMQEKHQIDSIEALNMKFKQVQDFYNDVIATYEHDNMFESATDEPLAIENIMMTMMSFQSLEHNHDILLSALMDAVDVVADEYGFMDALYDMKEKKFREYLEKEVFLGAESLYLNFISLLDMRNALQKNKKHDNDALYVTAILLAVNLSVFNMIRKERFVLEQERAKVKIKRNDPCPCGSGKKYKKCCLNHD